MDQKLLEILACPICKGKINFDKKNNELICTVDKLAYPIKENIPVMIVEEARTLTEEEYK